MMAEPAAVALYREMEASAEFKAPVPYAQIRPETFDAASCRAATTRGCANIWRARRSPRSPTSLTAANSSAPSATVRCWPRAPGPAARIPRARASPCSGGSARRASPPPRSAAFQLTRLWLGDYYRTYDEYMAHELVSHLRAPGDYSKGPLPIPLGRDSDANPRPGFTDQDGVYISARWPGDAYKFGRVLARLVLARSPRARYRAHPSRWCASAASGS